MENASKALLIAGAVLIAMLVLSLGVYFARMMADENARIYKHMEESKKTEFNQKFLNFNNKTVLNNDTIGSEYTYENTFIDARDIATLIYLAKDSNKSNELINSDAGKQETLYVSVSITNVSSIINGDNAEQIEDSKITDFLNNNKGDTEKTYSCIISINPNTGYVNHIEIKP